MSKLNARGLTTDQAHSAVDRRSFAKLMGSSAIGIGLAGCSPDDRVAAEQSISTPEQTPVPAQTETSQSELTPDAAMQLLRAGNARFVEARMLRRDYAQQIRATASGQYPFAIVLGCVDSRVPIETIFDQGIGDIFAARVAGNVVNNDMLGSMEFACNLAGAKVVLVLGHTSCGAVKGAISGARLGSLTGLVEKIEPAIGSVTGERSVDDLAYVDRVAEANVAVAIEQIRERSPILFDMESAGSIVIVGGMYDVSTGEVRFI